MLSGVDLEAVEGQRYPHITFSSWQLFHPLWLQAAPPPSGDSPENVDLEAVRDRLRELETKCKKRAKEAAKRRVVCGVFRGGKGRAI